MQRSALDSCESTASRNSGVRICGWCQPPQILAGAVKRTVRDPVVDFETVPDQHIQVDFTTIRRAATRSSPLSPHLATAALPSSELVLAR